MKALRRAAAAAALAAMLAGAAQAVTYSISFTLPRYLPFGRICDDSTSGVANCCCCVWHDSLTTALETGLAVAECHGVRAGTSGDVLVASWPVGRMEGQTLVRNITVPDSTSWAFYVIAIDSAGNKGRWSNILGIRADGTRSTWW